MNNFIYEPPQETAMDCGEDSSILSFFLFGNAFTDIYKGHNFLVGFRANKDKIPFNNHTIDKMPSQH